VLCKYGIEYVEDPDTFERIPTCHRASYDAVTEDDDYLMAIQHADSIRRELYEAEAKRIEELQKDVLDIVKKENIPFTIHSGEADGVESLKSAIEFGAKRIGHGVRCVEDKNVLNLIKEKKIYLEVCPTSNLDTKIFSSIEKHSIKELVDNDILVTINTDNRTVSNTNLDKEYSILRDAFNFTVQDFIKFNLNAIDAAFISEEEKIELRNRLLDE
jgi:adenosine deaminase